MQTLTDAATLSALLPGVSCAEQLLAEPFLLSCLLSRPSDLSPFLSHFLPLLLNHPFWPDVSSPPFPILTSYLHISLILQGREHPLTFLNKQTYSGGTLGEEHSQLFSSCSTLQITTFQEVKNLHQNLVRSRLIEGGLFNHHWCLYSTCLTGVPLTLWLLSLKSNKITRNPLGIQMFSVQINLQAVVWFFLCGEIKKHCRKMPKVYMGIGSPALIKNQENSCLRVVHAFETLSFTFQEKAKMTVSSCIEMSWWRQKTFNTPLWLRNTEYRDLETKSHFNSHLHTSRSSLENCSEGSCAGANLSSCTAFEIENLLHWKAEILWVLDVISWMLSSAPMNGKK